MTRENGDVVFQPQTVPGRYAIYYMPYQQPETTSGAWNGSYLPALASAESEWLAKHGLNVPTVENSIRFVETPKKDEGTVLNASFEMIAGNLASFADNDYTMTYETRFANHRGHFVGRRSCRKTTAAAIGRSSTTMAANSSWASAARIAKTTRRIQNSSRPTGTRLGR